MSACKRCGKKIPKNGIHLFRDWPGRKEAVEKQFPNAEISLCKNPPPESFFEELSTVDERRFSEVLARLRDVRKWATTNQGDPWAFRQALIVVMAIDTNVAIESGVDAEGLDEFDMVSRAFAMKFLKEDLEASG